MPSQRQHCHIASRRSRTVSYLLAISMAFTAIGCRSPYYADRGAAVGGLTGAGLGAAIGEANDEPLAGALIGSAIGAVTGSVVGNDIDNSRAEQRAADDAYARQQTSRFATTADIMAMAQAGLSDDVIATHLQTHGLAQPPSTQELIQLKQQGASDAIIRMMQSQQPTPNIIPSPGPSVVVEHVIERPQPMWVPRVGIHHTVHGRRHRRHHIDWGFSVWR